MGGYAWVTCKYYFIFYVNSWASADFGICEGWGSVLGPISQGSQGITVIPALLKRGKGKKKRETEKQKRRGRAGKKINKIDDKLISSQQTRY